MKRSLRVMALPLRIALDVVLFLPFCLLCFVSRLKERKNDIGIGPEPIISHKYQKKALEQWGYSVQTFVNSVYFLTADFDIRGDLFLGRFGAPFLPYLLFMWAIFNCKALYVYFNGGPLFPSPILWRWEPAFYKMAGIKVVVMPYGWDIQELSRCQNLAYKAAMSKDYPNFRFRRKKIERRIDLWTRYADHTVSGCDWAEYMYHWDTLCLAHFTIDVAEWKPVKVPPEKGAGTEPLKILHAPNHRHIKGTKHFISAVESLKQAGHRVDLIILEKVPNDRIKEMISQVDLVADQLIIGWYGMFAVEAMALGKPVLCYIRPDFEEFFIQEGLIEVGELPIIKCTPRALERVLVPLIEHREQLDAIGERSRAFVVKHHSTEAIGRMFDKINRSMGVMPKSRSGCNHSEPSGERAWERDV